MVGIANTFGFGLAGTKSTNLSTLTQNTQRIKIDTKSPMLYQYYDILPRNLMNFLLQYQIWVNVLPLIISWRAYYIKVQRH